MSSRGFPAEGTGSAVSSTISERGEGGVRSIFERRGADSAKASLGSPGGGVPPADGDRMGREVAAEQRDVELTVATAAAGMEWVERHGNNAGTMDVEVSDLIDIETSDLMDVETSDLMDVEASALEGDI